MAANELRMSREAALNAANKIKQISLNNAEAIKSLERINNELREGWDSDAQRAYEKCYNNMKNKLNTYTELLSEYSNTLTRVTENAFSTDSEYAHNILSKFGGD